MIERFGLPDVAAVARRTMIGALCAGVVGMVIALLVNQPWAALGLGIGLGSGMLNFRLIIRSVLKAGRRAEGSKRRPLAMNTLGRLMVMTVLALVLLWFVPPLGFGIIGGMALFQFILLANVTRAMLKGGGSGGTGLLAGMLGGGGLGALGAIDDLDDLDGPAGSDGASPALESHDDGWGAA